MSANSRYRYLCHHEAGHALADWYFGYRTDRVTALTVGEIRAGMTPTNPWGEPVAGAAGFASGYSTTDEAQMRMMLSNGLVLPPELLTIQHIKAQIQLINCNAGLYAEAAYRRVSPDAVALGGAYGDMQQARAILDFWFPDEEERREAAELADRRASALIRSRCGSAAIKAMAGRLEASGELDAEGIDVCCTAAYGGRRPAYDAWVPHWPPSLADLRAGVIPRERPARAAE